MARVLSFRLFMMLLPVKKSHLKFMLVQCPDPSPCTAQLLSAVLSFVHIMRNARLARTALGITYSACPHSNAAFASHIVSTRSFRAALAPRRPFASKPVSPVTSASAPSSHGLTHVDASGQRPAMVDVGDKAVTRREAVAESMVLLPDDVAKLFDEGKKEWQAPKGQSP
jgi:hypothetical protein